MQGQFAWLRGKFLNPKSWVANDLNGTMFPWNPEGPTLAFFLTRL